MRHKKVWRKLNRDRKHRKALFRNLATQLVEHERITTTLPKAKEMRSFVEKLVHKAKRGTNADVNYIKEKLFTANAVEKLQNEIAPRFKELPAGFTRVTSLGKRLNDKANVSDSSNSSETLSKSTRKLRRRTRSSNMVLSLTGSGRGSF